MRPSTMALAFAAAVSVGFVAYDLSGLSHTVHAETAAAAAVPAAATQTERDANVTASVQQQVDEILAQRARDAARATAAPTGNVPVGLPRTDTPAEFAELRDDQYREMVRQRSENPELIKNDGISIEDLLRMKERGDIIQ